VSSTTPNFNFILPAVNSPVDQDLWGGYLNENWSSLDTILAGLAPEGTVQVGTGMDYWGTTAPTGYVFAYGQALNRTTYADLFAIMGTTYGAGDGSTTFNIPDKRGRASFGQDDMGGTSADRLTGLTGGIDGDTLGAVGGEQAHALTEAENGPHTHPYDQSRGGPTGSPNYTYGEFSTEDLDKVTGSSGSGTPHNTVPPAIICNYIIYTGV